METSRFKRMKQSPKRRTLDGILSARDLPSSGSIGFHRRKSYRPSGATTIGDFRRPDGYYPAEQPSIDSDKLAAASAATHESMDQSESKPHKRRGRHGKPHKTLSWRKRMARGALLVLLIFILTGGFLFGKAWWKSRNIFKGGTAGAAALDANVDPTKLRGEGDGRVNILILGKGGPGHDGPDLTDTMLVASIDPINKDAALLSIPRDLYVRATNIGSTKINSVYALNKMSVLNGKKIPNQASQAESAGLDAVQKTVEDTIGIPIHYRVMVDFEGFRKAIDTVGGVTIDVKQEVYDPTVAWENNNNPLIASVGLHTFNGKQALLYARSRHGSPRGDFDRSVRQREILLALKDKVLSAGTYSNPLKISQLIDAFGDHVQTNLSVSEMRRLYTISKDINGSNVASLGLADPPNEYVTTGNIGGLSVVIPKAGLYDYSAIQNFVRNALKDGFIKNENANITVLNGTSTAGLATKKTTELKSYGYNVGTVGDAPTKTYTKTIIVDLRNGTKKYTKHYLEQRFNTTAISSLPDSSISPGSADFVIILGQNDAN